MPELTTDQVNFVERDVKARGISIPGLHENLVDHICCILEDEMEESDDFNVLYQKTISRFFKNELSELETETNALLEFKNYYNMRKIMILSGLFAVISLATGILFKFLYLPGTAILITLGIVAFSLVFLPLYFTLRTKERKEKSEKILAALAVFSGMVFSMSILFKVMHWPGANIMLFGTLVLVGAVFLPVYLITGLRNPLTRINTVVTSVMIFIACGLMLTLTASPRRVQAEKIVDTQNYLWQEEVIQNEWKMLGTDPELDPLVSEIMQLTSQIKSEVLLESAGTSEIKDSSEAMIKNGWLKWEGHFKIKIDSLKGLLAEYNEKAKDSPFNASVNNPPLVKLEAISAVGALNDLFQIRMTILNNEQKKILSLKKD